MIERNIVFNDDPKYIIKYKLKNCLLDKMYLYDEQYNSNKLKTGRPTVLTNEQYVDAILYVLFEGVTWSIASKLVTGTYKYRSTL